MSYIDSFITYDLTKKQYYLLHLQSYMYLPLPEDIGAFNWFLGNIDEQQ